MTDSDVPTFYANNVNVALNPFDVMLTFLEQDSTALPENQEGPHAPTIKAVVQVRVPLGHAKSMLPLLATMIARYETMFGEIPAPGFDDLAKE